VGTNLYVRFYGYGKGSGTQSGSEDEKHSLAQKEAQSLGRSAQAGALSIPVAQHAHETQGSFELDNKHQAAKIVRGKIIR
jgi:hypothetical protein